MPNKFAQLEALLQTPYSEVAGEMEEKLRPEQQKLGVTHAILALEEQIVQLRQKNDQLQRIVDESTSEIIARIDLEVCDYASATAATQLYGLEWFGRQFYSYASLQRIAQALSQRASPFLENPFWQSIIDGNFDQFVVSDELPERKIPLRKLIYESE